MTRSTPLLAGLFFCLTGALFAANPPLRGLVGALSTEEFARAGLAKLTNEELTALDAALSRHIIPPASKSTAPTNLSTQTTSTTKNDPPLLGAEQVAMLAKPADTSEQLHTRIEGSLDGFSGRAVFAMENGQIWQVRIPESVSFVRKLTNPEVVITRGTFGYKMLIVAADRVIAVKRIQ